jgi:hypothetical protein
LRFAKKTNYKIWWLFYIGIYKQFLIDTKEFSSWTDIQMFLNLSMVGDIQLLNDRDRELREIIPEFDRRETFAE